MCVKAEVTRSQAKQAELEVALLQSREREQKHQLAAAGVQKQLHDQVATLQTLERQAKLASEVSEQEALALHGQLSGAKQQLDETADVLAREMVARSNAEQQLDLAKAAAEKELLWYRGNSATLEQEVVSLQAQLAETRDSAAAYKQKAGQSKQINEAENSRRLRDAESSAAEHILKSEHLQEKIEVLVALNEESAATNRQLTAAELQHRDEAGMILHSLKKEANTRCKLEEQVEALQHQLAALQNSKQEDWQLLKASRMLKEVSSLQHEAGQLPTTDADRESQNKLEIEELQSVIVLLQEQVKDLVAANAQLVEGAALKPMWDHMPHSANNLMMGTLESELVVLRELVSKLRDSQVSKLLSWWCCAAREARHHSQQQLLEQELLAFSEANHDDEQTFGMLEAQLLALDKSNKQHEAEVEQLKQQNSQLRDESRHQQLEAEMARKQMAVSLLASTPLN